MEKLWNDVRLRLPETMYAEIKMFAETDHRPLMHQVRWLLERGLEQRRAVAVQGSVAAIGGVPGPFPPRRAAYCGIERRKVGA